MASPGPSADSVRVTLSLDDPSRQDIPFPVRELTLNKDNKSIVVGRASKVETKGLVSLPDNAWFLSPVVSRQHAEISANIDDKKVMIEDLGSLHGTFVNGEKVRLLKGEPRELKDGDKVQLGVSIYRGNDLFPPTTVGVSIKHTHQEDKRDECPTTTTFQVPDCSDAEDYSSDDHFDLKEITEKTMPVKITSAPVLPRTKLGSTPAAAIDLTQPRRSGTPHHSGVYEVIDLSSPPQSPGPALTDDEEDSASIAEVPALIPDNTDLPPSSSAASPDLSTASPELSATIRYLPDLTNLNGKYNDSELSDLDSSIQLSSDDEDMSMDDGYGSDDTNSERSVSGNDDADDNHSVMSSEVDHLQSEGESFLADDNEEDNNDIDLEEDAEFDVDYSSEDEGSNNGFPDVVFKSAFWDEVPLAHEQMHPAKSHPQSSVNGELHKAPSPPVFEPFEATPYTHLPHISPPKILLRPSMISSEPPSNPSIVNIKTLLNDEKAPADQRLDAEPRLPEDVDTTLPTPPTYTAREPSPSDAAMPKSCHITSAEKRKTTAEVLGEITGKGEFFAAREENKVLAKTFKPPGPRFTPSVQAICNNGVGVAASAGCGPFALPTAGKTAEKPSVNMYRFADIGWAPVGLGAVSPLDIPGQARTEVETETPAQPLPQTWASRPSGVQRFTIARFGGYEDQSSRRTHLGISDIVDGCQQTTAHPNENKGTEEPTGSKEKRKSEEISDSTLEEEQWAQVGGLQKEQSVPPSSTEQPPAAQETHDEALAIVAEPAKIVTSISRDINDRPTKRLRHIAERFGYAALGGVTAGAMIFGTLVYTAPTFV